ncbi:MAG: gliding motility-associated C-terminal domain-containing protein [Bacteroidales bacterium]|nr:gliding motility-associated C-terminal domain-containing protein [Bacteroidales bacterium]
MINSSKPVMVAQFAKGIKCSGDITGDPFMMLIPPLEQFLTHYTIINHAFASNWVNVIAPDTAIGSIFMDGSLVPSSEFTQIGSTNYFGAQLNVVEGSHSFSSNFPIGVFVYGWKNANSYGYPGGCSISPVASVSSITLSPDTSYGQLNVTSVCVNAHVTDSQNNSLKGILVNFNISGLSTLTGFAYTDSLGNAQFCYTRSGNTPGVDHIFAESSGIISNSVVVFWNNTIPCINPTDGGIIGNSQNGCGNYQAAPLQNLMSPSGQSGNLEYKWQLSTIGNSSGFSDIPGTNSDSFNPGILSQTTWFKRIARVDCESDWTGAAESNVIQITVIPLTIVFNDDSLNISPTTCGGQNGAITGLKISGTAPLSITWINKISGQVIGHSEDLYNLAVGLYELSITDGNGCSLPAISYVIKDVGDIMIDTVNYSASDCNKPNGIINVVAVSGLGSRIQYFLKSGNDTISQWHHGDFPGLATGTYYVWVSDSSGCTSVYSKPVQIANPPGPQVTGSIVIPATYLKADGKIMISATSTGDTLYYSINGGIAQINNGNFNNLASGLYSCTVTDEKGCDTTFTVNIGEIYSVRLEAIAGDGSACLGNVAVLPLQANSFSHVSSFDSRLKYNKAQVTCQNYLNANPALADSLKVDRFPALGEISLTWTGKNPVNLPDGSTLVELSFASLLSGQDSLKWDIAPGICTFLDSLGNNIAPEFKQGQVRVYTLPKGRISAPENVCEGEDLLLIGNYEPGSGNGSISYNWTGPENFSLDNPLAYIPVASVANSGIYNLQLSDTNHCESSYSATVNVIPTPVSGFTRDTLYFDEQTRLEAAQGYNSYAWNTGDSTYSILVTSEGWYKVTMKTPEGCMATDSIMMLYSFAPFNMPNAFTPDGDGKNDVFRPVTLPEKVQSFSMYIYDRWGRQVYATKDLGNGWNGSIDGKPAPVGVYTYIISYGNQTGEVRKKTGMVTLVR